MKCNNKCEVYSRCCGYHRPTSNWNIGKKEEFKERVVFKESTCMEHVCSASGSITEALDES